MNYESILLDGVLDSPIDERDYTLDMVEDFAINEDLPEEFSLEYKFSAKNQHVIPSCVGHALSACKEIIDDEVELYSAGFIYGNRAETDSQGRGTVTREALKQMVKCGTVYQKDFPVNVAYPEIANIMATQYDKKDLLKKALLHKSESYIRLDIDEIKSYIYTEKKPVVVSINVYESFHRFGSDYIMPYCSGDKQGRHLVVILGWKGNTLKMLNSWGPNWGNRGYGYLRLDDELLYNEAWALTDKRIIRPVTPPPTNNVSPTGKIAYRVQIGAFAVRANAEKLIKELDTKGIASCIVLYPDKFKVQCGYFLVKENAKNMLNKLKDLGYKDAFITIVK